MKFKPMVSKTTKANINTIVPKAKIRLKKPRKPIMKIKITKKGL